MVSIRHTSEPHYDDVLKRLHRLCCDLENGPVSTCGKSKLNGLGKTHSRLCKVPELTAGQRSNTEHKIKGICLWTSEMGLSERGSKNNSAGSKVKVSSAVWWKFGPSRILPRVGSRSDWKRMVLVREVTKNRMVTLSELQLWREEKLPEESKTRGHV